MFWSFCSSFSGKYPFHPRKRHDTGLAHMKKDVHPDSFLHGWRCSAEMQCPTGDRYIAFFVEITMRSAVGRWEARLRVALDFAVSAACDQHALH